MIIVEEVQDQEQKKEFLQFPAVLYQHDKNYIRPLDKDIEEVFDPSKNKFFKTGECQRFLFKNKNNQTVGKVAVFINTFYKQDQPTGGLGFFDCINDQETANFILIIVKTGCTKEVWRQWMDLLILEKEINSGVSFQMDFHLPYLA
ncbi:hypothetical protein MTQ00_18480 [Chryseobacterium sp. B21-037]|uniref:hypothetical protein n=1 Tax=Chryseobacterium sp. B21-037 TaxID=2926038 RepID=UPI002359967E|nr:hypothetical protein [Chryseobacterium sp. B21-037]MDC8106509.1 hypothetical protein [Chryseobacterium sp. B21-037]